MKTIQTLQTTETETGAEAHISSILVHIAPPARDGVAKQIARLTGAEIHDAGAEGKLIVTLETSTLYEVTEAVDAISRLDGVITAVLVYHHVDRPECLDDLVEAGMREHG